MVCKALLIRRAPVYGAGFVQKGYDLDI